MHLHVLSVSFYAFDRAAYTICRTRAYFPSSFVSLLIFLLVSVAVD